AREGAVIQVLALRRPALVPELLALDRGSGWMLQRDGGTRLRGLVIGADLVDRWAELLPLYAALQLDAAADRDALVAAGAPDRGLSALPQAYAQLAEDVGGAFTPEDRSAAGRSEEHTSELQSPDHLVCR